jgi:HlyD family secretion protein
MRLEMLLKPSLLITLVLIAGLTALGVNKFIARTKKQPIPYTIEKANRRNIVQYITASGTVKAKTKDQISIGSLAAGKVEKLLADDNDVVKKNQILAVLDNGIGKNGVKVAAAQLEQAKAQLTYQELFLKRQKALFEAEEISENAYDLVVLNHAQAAGRVAELEANLEIEKRKYEDLFIRAPENGTITARKIELGQMITSQLDAKVLFEEIKDLTAMEVWADVDEADIGLVKDGQEAQFTVDTYANRQFKSKISLIQFNAKTVDNAITYAAVLSAANPNIELRPGMTANVDIKVADKKEVLCVPYSAQRINSLQLQEYAKKNNLTCTKITASSQPGKRKDSLWIFENNGFKEIPVTFGARDNNFIEVSNGLSETQDVVTKFLLITDNSSALKSMFGGGLGGSK